MVEPLSFFAAAAALFTGLVLGNHGPAVQLEIAEQQIQRLDRELAASRHESSVLKEELVLKNTKLQMLETRLALADSDILRFSSELDAMRRSLSHGVVTQRTLLQELAQKDVWEAGVLATLDAMKERLEAQDTLVRLGREANQKLLAAQAALKNLRAEAKELAGEKRKLRGDYDALSLEKKVQEGIIAALTSKLQEREKELARANELVGELQKKVTFFKYSFFAALSVVIIFFLTIVSMYVQKRRHM